MRLSRRHLFRSGAAVGAGGAVAGGLGAAGERAAGEGAASEARLAGSGAPATLGSVIERGRAGAKGYARLVRGRGERHGVRTDLGVKAGRGRARRRKPLLAFVQLSDVHMIDAQSPLRVEWTDRFDDPSQVPTSGIFTSAYRPQEMLSAQIADAMVRQVNRIKRGPVTGKPLALAIQTGDNSDNSQLNEIRWNIDVLSGGRVRPDSGDLTRWEGVADDDPTYYDTHYWHPEGGPEGAPPDNARELYGFPVVPGLLDAARRPFDAVGLDIPWYTAFGNHDGLAQGNFPLTLQFNNFAVGGVKIITLPPGVTQADVVAGFTDPAGLLAQLAVSPGARPVTPDPDRRLLTRGEMVDEHFKTSGKPVGHGFTRANREAETAYYTFDKGVVRFVCLDTVNPNGYANGSLDATQFGWLEEVLARSRDRLVVVYSHHTSSTMDNPFVGTGGDLEPRVMGAEVLELLLASPEVVAWVNGHSHRNRITAHRRARGGGLWEINTAAHIDWPLQSRIIEICDNRDGTVSLFTTIVDHAGPLDFGGDLTDTVHLAALARELAANDWHDRTDAARGTPGDRNVELLVRAPRFLR